MGDAPIRGVSELRAADGEATIAVVNGVPISRAAVVELLMQSHGVGVLEQIIGFEVVRKAAEDEGVAITDRDVEQEYDLALRRLVDPLTTGGTAPLNPASPVTPDTFDRSSAEAVLDTVLGERNISHDEFSQVIRRNAYLRKIAQKNMQFGNDELREEFDRVYGRRAQVRHIQLGSPGDVTRVSERLAAGEDFADLAGRYSANVASGKRGGLLDPFSLGDPSVPDAFRQAAFALRPGQVSPPVRTGAWEHFIKLERVLEPEPISFDAVREELAMRLRERLADERMPGLHEKLVREARIEIGNPALREAFYKKHPQHRRDERR